MALIAALSLYKGGAGGGMPMQIPPLYPCTLSYKVLKSTICHTTQQHVINKPMLLKLTNKYDKANE